MKKFKPHTPKRFAALLLSFFVAASVLAGMPLSVNAEEASITFDRQIGGVFDGMPLFDGNPDHLDAFVDTYYDYIGLEGACLYATGIRDNYTFVWDGNPEKGRTVPGGLAAADQVFGVSTDFPSLEGLGQTWNKDLVTQIGEVMGSEKISQLNVKQGTANIHNGPSAQQSKPIAFTVLQDMRINPLCGRYYEAYGEDAYHTASLIDYMAAGLAGTNLDESEDGFWQRAVVGTKHYSLYTAEWFRQQASNTAGARAIYEYQTKSAFKGLESGSISGVMTSFGRTNGIPNIISPYMILGDNIARYGMYSSPDFNGENHLYGTSFGNGYDTRYTLDRQHGLALMVLAHSESVRAMGTDKTDVITLLNAVQNGVYGITYEDVKAAGRPLVNTLVRIGIFNKVDNDKIPINYPFAQYAKDVAPVLTDYNTPEHQEVALQAARETVVLLKNIDGALPLSKTAKAAVTGTYGDMRIRPRYAASTPNIENSGKTPLYQIIRTIGPENLLFSSGAEVVALKSKLNGQYLTAGEGEGAQLVANYTTVDGQFTDAQKFELYDWGNSATSLKSVLNNLWLTAPSAANSGVGNTASLTMNLTAPDWSSLTSLATNSAIPAKLRFEHNADGSLSIISNGLRFQTGVFSGRFLATGSDGKIATAADTIGNLDNFNTRTDATSFEKTVVKPAGADAASWAETQDYALVFVGADPGNSAGEGNDRASLYMGDGDYELVHNVAAAFAAKGKKTIVVVLTSFPVIMEEIQNDPNVSAIITQPYSGEFDAQGLIDVLYGDYAPTGRLASTWYKDMSALPAINQFSIPEGRSETLSQLDPRYTVDMTNADPAETELTYMYTDAPVTYEFGYGLPYGYFTYKDFTAPSSADSEGNFIATVEITNEGSVSTSETVQLYIRKINSAYGEYVPKKQLVSYEKVFLTSGEHAVVTLSVDPNDFAIWDVNRGDYIVEAGEYELMVGASSEDIRFTKTINIAGDQVATLSGQTSFNVFDHSFMADHVIYNEVSKNTTVESLRAEKIAGGYYAVQSKSAGAWVAIPKVDLADTVRITARVATNAAPGMISLCADSPANTPFAAFNVPVTGPVSYNITDVTVNELGYTNVEAVLNGALPTGEHDLYVVFQDSKLRIDSIQLLSTEAPVITAIDPVSGPEAGGTIVTVTGSNFTNATAVNFGSTPATGFTIVSDTTIEAVAPAGNDTVDVTVSDPGGPSAVSDATKFHYIVDKTALEVLIAQAQALNEEDYTPETWSGLNSALAAALVVQNDVDATHSQVADAASALSNAIDGLEAIVPVVDLAAVSEALPDTDFTVTVGLAGKIVDIYAEDITITYNSDLFDFVKAESVSNNIIIANSDTILKSPGTLRIMAANNGGITGDAAIFTLTFHAKNTEGAGQISVTSAKLGSPFPVPSGSVFTAETDTISVAVTTTVPVESITIDQGETLSLTVGDTGNLTATIIPDNASNKTITWASDNASVVTVHASTGEYNALAAGTATITATTANGKSDSITVTVEEQEVPATAIILDKNEARVAVGNSVSIGATLVPAGATSDILWSSSNTGVATVDQNGTVTAITSGTAVITAESSDNPQVKAECIITVYKAGDTNNDGDINVGDLAIVAYYYDAEEGDANWSAAKEVDFNGDKIIDIFDLAYIAMRIED